MDRFELPVMVILLSLLTISKLPAQDSGITLNLMPIPAKIVYTDSKFRLDETFTVSVNGNAGDRLYKGATRMLRRLSGRTGLFFPQDYIAQDTKIDTACMIIECTRSGKVVLNEDESYRLDISTEKITLSAETDIGVIRGLETFLQLLDTDDEGYYIHSVNIEDSPRFPWRGLLIDPGRHFMPVEVIKRNLDGMAAVKLNVLHWHLTEDQGFRVECKTYPRLHQMGSDGFYYTQEQIKDVIAYAADRGIRVMPEFDIPGHTTSWVVGYPELASAPGPYTIERTWGVKDPTLDPTREETYTFLDNFFGEMTQLFPDEYVHIGGDENNGRQWNANPEIQEFIKENDIPDNHALQSYFNKRILSILTKYNRKMVGWDEIFQPDLPTDIVIHSWRGRRALVESAQKGYQAMLSNGYYIDLIRSTDYHYRNDPIPEDSPLTDEEKKYILGGEATMWGEYISPETIDSRIWPRTAAIAERFWSPGHVKDVDAMYRRLEVVSFHLEELGLTHEKNYEMMLRRLTNNADIAPLKNLVDVIEPLKGYARGRQREYTSYSPLTRVVDAARPDAKVARVFRNLVDIYLSEERKGDTEFNDIKGWLILWQNNHIDLVEIIKSSPVLKEVETLSEDLSKIAGIGLQALAHIKSGQRADSDWVTSQLEVLRKARAQRGQTELMIIPAIRNLVNAAEKIGSSHY